MRDLRLIEIYRKVHPKLGDSSDQPDFGYFELPDGMRIIASSGMGWDHVSCSYETRTPTWDEMVKARDLFFSDEETVIQYHPPKSKYVNRMPYCLHLWRKHDFEMPLPDSKLIG